MTPNQLKFLKIVKEKHYFERHDKVLVALSGGQDSMTLFNWLYDLQEKLDIKLGIAHINHGVRVESEHEEQAIREMSDKLAVPIYVDRFTGEFTERDAREFRYKFFDKIMHENAYTAVVTAHHKGDVVETVLMREITGRPLRSLQGISDCQPFATGELIRPLLEFEKIELDAPVFFEDWTNHGTDQLRNRIRNQLIPNLKKENPQFTEAILSLTSEISMAMSIITDRISELDIVSKKISLTDFCQQSKALQHFILQEYFAQFPELSMNKSKFEELIHIINRPQQYREKLNKTVLFVKTKDEFYIEKYYPELEQDADKKLSVLTENPNDDSFMQVNLPATGKIVIRKRAPGDVILINGHHKKLRKYFIEQKIPLEKRNNLLIFVEKELYAVVDVVCSDLSKSAKNDKMGRTLWVKPSVREEKQHA